jgi:nucleoside-diphosphate-sugar epimerase
MNYLISGQSGFIGSSITKYLKERGHNVYNIPRHYAIRELILYFKQSDSDYIIHLASYGNHYYQQDFRQMVETNIIGTYNLLEAAKTVDYKLFYNVSSSSVALEHSTYYSITKSCAENLAKMYPRVLNCHPYSVYGPNESKDKFIPRVIECLSTGEKMTIDEDATHDWIFISDFIEALLAGETELGTGVKTSNIEVVRMLEDISGKKLDYIPGKLRSYDNDNWVAKKGVPSINIYEGLKKTYEYFTR